jgi:dedicated sortase system histidine kinase
VELRVPRTFADDAIGFAVADTDGDGTTHWIGTGGATPPDALLPVAQRRPKATNRLTRMLPKATRAWLVDRNGWVLARAGEVEPAAGSGGRWLRNLLYRHVLASPLQPPAHRGSLTAQLDGDEVTTALTGNPATAWRGAERGSGVVVSAARPVTDASGRPVGALVVERASEGVLLLTERALVQLLGTILFTVTVALAVLMLFAARLSSRIRRLRDAAAGAVDAEGRVSPALPETDARDELGDLSRSLSRTLEGLREYTRYLRSLASRLSHELRTPLAMVSSSLENLAQEDLDTRSQTYAHRARDGAERLSRILRAMSEATRIEESIRGEEREPLELDALLRNFVDAYRDLRPDRRFEVRIAEGDYRMSGAPELIGQMLDKLVDNAVSFSPRDGWIRLGLRRLPESLEVTVANQGPALPEEMSERLFDSLVSVREPATGGDGTPHLGLGLYVVRLVAEMHGGDVRAANLPNAEGVVFTVTLARRAANS